MSVSVCLKLRLAVLLVAWDLDDVAPVYCCCVCCSDGLQLFLVSGTGCSVAMAALIRPPVVGIVAGCHCTSCSRRCSCRGSSVMPWAPLSVLVAAECCGGYSVDAVQRRVGRGRLGVGLSRTLLAVGHVRGHAVPVGVGARRVR